MVPKGGPHALLTQDHCPQQGDAGRNESLRAQHSLLLTPVAVLQALMRGVEWWDIKSGSPLALAMFYHQGSGVVSSCFLTCYQYTVQR